MTQSKGIQKIQPLSLIGQRAWLQPKASINKAVKIFVVALLLVAIVGVRQRQPQTHSHSSNLSVEQLPDLAMSGGDPYIRALMLTISASESNHRNAYSLLYGGNHVHSLAQHPDQCLVIEVGPNQGQCSTAAGRYQFLTPSWQEKAAQYHPHPHQDESGVIYGFDPEYQDIVVHRWLEDSHAWNVDIPSLLRQGQVEAVLMELSSVWTSLEGGIEENSITPYLPEIYQHFLDKELNG